MLRDDAEKRTRYSESEKLPDKELLGHEFRDPGMLLRALTHSSYINEHRLSRGDCNERLEFLGDAVLETVSSLYLYRLYPDAEEGRLTRMRASMVSEPPLAECARRLGLGGMLRMGKGERETGGADRPSILSDAVEAIIGALYLDGGMEAAERFILRHILTGEPGERSGWDAKTRLQELLQKDGQEEPVYVLIGTEGPEHARIFTSQVLWKGTCCGTGKGSSRKQSEQEAAREALKRLTQDREGETGTECT